MRKDWEEVRQIRSVLVMIFALPLLLVVIGVLTFYYGVLPTPVREADIAVYRLIIAGGTTMTAKEVLMHFWANQWLIYLLLAPGVVPTVIASFSIVGEKVQKTLEPLLATPASDQEILIGKTLAGVLPALASTFLAFAVYVVAIDYASYPLLGYLLVPTPAWLLAMVVLAPLLAFLGVFLLVLVSSRTSDVRSAQQIGAVVVVPIIVLFVLQLGGRVAFTVEFVLLGIGVLIAADLFLLRLAQRIFHREAILTRWK